MNQQTCNRDRLDAFLKNDLNEHEEQMLTSHLDECSDCREELESRAAEQSVWREASNLLGGSILLSTSAIGASPSGTVHSPQIALVLQQLAPTDDPESLGRIGGYEVTGVVGAGGMGVVLKAHDRSLDRIVAIKVMAPHLASSGSARKRFAREAKAAAAVLHPNVIAIHSVASEDANPYLVMPFVRGASLQRRIDTQGPLPLKDTLRIGAQIAAGLAAAHEQGLVHRDIKPANILLEEGVERVTITDFGLARAVDDASMTCSGVIAGTPQYMSPEQARGEPVDARSDLFSLGGVLYAMCTGRSPFRAETTYGVLHRIANDKPTSVCEVNTDVPVWLGHVIDRLMAKRPEDRFESATQVAELLEGCLAHVQLPAAMPLPSSVEQLSHLLPVSSSASQQAKKQLGQLFYNLPPIGKFVAAAAGAFALLFAGVFVVLELNKGTLAIQSEVDDIRIRITSSEKVIDELKVTKAGKSIQVAAGQYNIEVIGETDDLTIENGHVTLHRADTEVVRIVHNKRTPNKNEVGKTQSADEWLAALQGSWYVEQVYLENGVLERHASPAVVRENLMEVTPHIAPPMTFELVFGEIGPPQQIDIRATLNDTEREQLMEGRSKTKEAPPQESMGESWNWKGIIQLREDGFHVCTHDDSGATRPLTFTDKAGRIDWYFIRYPKEEKSNAAVASSSNPLANSIDQFNLKRSKDPLNDQPILTKDELIACASWNLERNHDLTKTQYAALSKISKHHQWPEGWGIDGSYVDLPPDATQVRAYRISLVHSTTGEAFTVRERFLEPPSVYAKPILNASLEGTQLRAAIKRFNARYNQANGYKQPPLTENEVVAAILHHQTKREEADVSDALFERFQQIARQRYLPEETSLEVIPTFGVEGGSTYTIWSVRIKMFLDEAGKEGWTHAFKVREQFVSVKHRDAGEIHWGQPAENGLQAGVQLSPPLLSYELGQKIDVEVYYRNILTKPISATVPNFCGYEAAMQDANGNTMEILDFQEEIVGGARSEAIGNEPISSHGRSLAFAPSSLAKDKREEYGIKTGASTLAFVEPGNSYRLQFTVSNLADSAAKPLKTGEVEILVEKATTQETTAENLTTNGKGKTIVGEAAKSKALQPAKLVTEHVIDALVTFEFSGVVGNATLSTNGIGWIIDQRGHILVPDEMAPRSEDYSIEVRYADGSRTSAKRVFTFGHLALLKPEKAPSIVPIRLNSQRSVKDGDQVLAILNSTDVQKGTVTSAKKTIVSLDSWPILYSPRLRFPNAIETDFKSDAATLFGAPLLTPSGEVVGMLLNYKPPMFAIPLSEIQIACREFESSQKQTLENAVEAAQGTTNEAVGEQAELVNGAATADEAYQAMEKLLANPKMDWNSTERYVATVATRMTSNIEFAKHVLDHFKRACAGGESTYQARRNLLAVLSRAFQTWGQSRWSTDLASIQQHSKPSATRPQEIRDFELSALEAIVSYGHKARRSDIVDFARAARALHHPDAKPFLQDVALNPQNPSADPYTPPVTNRTNTNLYVWRDNLGGTRPDARFVAAVGLAELGDQAAIEWLLDKAKPNDFGLDESINLSHHERDRTGSLRESSRCALIDLFGLPIDLTVAPLSDWWNLNKADFTPRMVQLKADVEARNTTQEGKTGENARTVVESYIAWALGGEVANAASLAKNSPADPKQIRELPEFLNVQQLKIQTVYINDPAKPTQALATSVAVKLGEEHKNPNGRRDGFLVFTLEFTDEKWFVIDIDFETESGAEKELNKFLKANPNSIAI